LKASREVVPKQLSSARVDKRVIMMVKDDEEEERMFFPNVMNVIINLQKDLRTSQQVQVCIRRQ